MRCATGKATRDEGFTLVELAVVTVIVGILVAVAVASYGFSISRVTRITCENNRHVLEGAISVYAAEHNGTPPTVIEDLEPYANRFARIIVCPGDETTHLRLDAANQEIVCDFHQP